MINDESIRFQLSKGLLYITDATYTKSKPLIPPTQTPNLNDISGTWYDKEGNSSITFLDNGSYKEDFASGESVTGTYAYNKNDGTGERIFGKLSIPFRLSNGLLYISGGTYTKNKPTIPPTQTSTTASTAIIGIWYDENNKGEVQFYDTGIALITQYPNEQVTGEYTFNASTSTGKITATYNGEASTADMSLSNGVLTIGGQKFTQNKTEPHVSNGSIIGTWYDKLGKSGTLNFQANGKVILTAYGENLEGTYTFDETTGTGHMTLRGLTALHRFEHELKLENGMLHSNESQFPEDETVYTKDYVEQEKTMSRVQAIYEASLIPILFSVL